MVKDAPALILALDSDSDYNCQFASKNDNIYGIFYEMNNYSIENSIDLCDLERVTPALHLNEPAGGSCCDAGLGLVWYYYCIYMIFVCLIQKNYLF